ncbi:MAG: pyruvate, water dikinase, partial [Ilumatobacteraceae bacterium]
MWDGPEHIDQLGVKTMAEIVPVDQFLEWYPGWKPEHIDDPWLRMKSGPFTKEDESRFWFVDFHWPRGFSPLGFQFVSAAAWSTQLAAHQLPLPPAGGLVQRMGGPFLYEGEVPVASQWEIGFRAARIEKNMPKFLGNFDAIWEERKWELELGLGYFESYDFAGKSLAEIGQYLEDARTFQTRAWEIHFEIMYPLLAIYLQLYGLCAGNGIDPGNIAKMLQGRDSKIMETDRAMWDLADEANRLGIADLFEHEPDQIRDALSKAGGNASIWLTKFDDFLKIHGWRTEGIADINIPSWIENQASPLGQLRNFVQMEERHDFDKSLVDSHRERDEAIDAARSQLSGDSLAGFNQLLDICTVANFAWWNEDHNYYIDLRSSIPVRLGALAAAEAVGADTYDDTTFLFWPELQEVCRGDVAWKAKQSIATARHEYYDHYQDLRGEIPKVVGTLPDKVEDPVLIEIFGMHSHYFAGLKADPHTTTLSGFPASAGTYTGRARVMVSATELFDLEEGEILVTEATSPNWTPAFAIIGACV